MKILQANSENLNSVMETEMALIPRNAVQSIDDSQRMKDKKSCVLW